MLLRWTGRSQRLRRHKWQLMTPSRSKRCVSAVVGGTQNSPSWWPKQWWRRCVLSNIPSVLAALWCKQREYKEYNLIFPLVQIELCFGCSSIRMSCFKWGVRALLVQQGNHNILNLRTCRLETSCDKCSTTASCTRSALATLRWWDLLYSVLHPHNKNSPSCTALL